MPLYKYVDGVTSEMSAGEEAAFNASLPAAPPRTLSRKLFFEELAKDSNYATFQVWKATQDEERQVYFDEEAVFAEDSAHVTALFTHLSADVRDFYDDALT